MPSPSRLRSGGEGRSAPASAGAGTQHQQHEGAPSRGAGALDEDLERSSLVTMACLRIESDRRESEHSVDPFRGQNVW